MSLTVAGLGLVIAAAGFVGIVVPLTLWCLQAWCNILRVRKLHAEEAATTMFAYWHENSKCPDLPDKLKGVFWMSGNPAPELLAILMSGTHDSKARVSTILMGYEPFGWSWSTDWFGWLEYLAVNVLSMGSTLRFQWNEDYTSAEIPLYIFGCFGAYTGFTMKQADTVGNEWDRITYNRDGTVYEYGSYRLRKIIDHNGQKLPAFAEMLTHLKNKESDKGTVKTEVQLLNPSACCSCCCRCWTRRGARRVKASAPGSDAGAAVGA